MKMKRKLIEDHKPENENIINKGKDFALNKKFDPSKYQFLEEENSSGNTSDESVDFGEEEEEEMGTSSSEQVLAQKYDKEIVPSKKIKLSKKELYKAPTSSELNQLKETENLFHSNLFRMQVSELLNEVKLKLKKKKQIRDVFEKLKAFLQKISPGKQFDLSKPRFIEKFGIELPYFNSIPKNKGQFQFLPPVDIAICGSVAMDTVVKPDVVVDISLTIPKESIQEKDYLNQRYFLKKALYLAIVAKELKKKKDVENLEFSYRHGNRYHPVLCFGMSLEDSSKCVNIKLHVIPEKVAFKINRFHICKNNVRKQWFREVAEESSSEDNQPATPQYNSSLLQDLAMAEATRDLLDMQENQPGIREGIILLKVWLRQRQLNKGYGCFGNHILSMFVLYLLKKKKINKMMSSYQIMRNTLVQLSKSDWTIEGISLCDRPEQDFPSLKDFHSLCDVVFVDSSGYLNLCADMTKQCFQRVKHEATIAIEILQNQHMDTFSPLLMKMVPFFSKFDVFLHINTEGIHEKIIGKCQLESKELDFGCQSRNVITPYILNLIERALGKRILLLQSYLESEIKWSVDSSQTGAENCERLTIGLLLNQENFSSILDIGPQADTPEAIEFRKFWGDLSELRRFKDGSICEAVIWAEQDTPISERRSICGKIVKHVLKLHLDLPSSRITYVGDQLDNLLAFPPSLLNDNTKYGTGEEQCLAVSQCYDDLCKILRKLDLPLTINSIQGTSPVLRYAEVFPCLPCEYHTATTTVNKRKVPLDLGSTPPYIESIRVVCMMEGSGKWPEDKDAVRRLKSAFLLQLASMLEEKKLQVIVHPTHLDVKLKSYVFHVELAYMREIALRKLVTTPEGMVKFVDTEGALELERRNVALPQLTSTLHGLQQQHNTYSSAVRLAKRWLSSQMLADHVPEEAIELLMAHVYISKWPYTVPNSPLTGFLRFLRLISSHDWSLSPLYVDLNEKFTSEDFTEIALNFNSSRGSHAGMYISTPYDKHSNYWTKKAPTAPIIRRLILLAQTSLQFLEKALSNVSEGCNTDFHMVFRPSLEVYDVLINLNSKYLARRHESVDLQNDKYLPKVCNKSQKDQAFPVFNFDPVQIYLKELRDVYDNYALFFYDTHGGKSIGVVWKPHVLLHKDFKASEVVARKPQVEDLDSNVDMGLVANVEAILEDFKILGQGLVFSVTSK